MGQNFFSGSQSAARRVFLELGDKKMIRNLEKPSAEDFAILGVAPGALPSQVRAAYKKLVKSWHPDKFPPGSIEQVVAEDRIKAINAAYQRIRLSWDNVTETNESPIPAARGKPDAGIRPEPSSKETIKERSSLRSRTFRTSGVWIGWVANFHGWVSRRKKLILVFLGASGLFLIFTYWIRLPMPLSPPPQQISHPTLSVPSTPQSTSFPSSANSDTTQHLSSPSTPPTPVEKDEETVHTTAPVGSSVPENHYTLGSTKAEVLRIQGKPSRIIGSKWFYGLSDITFKEDRVWHFNNFDGSLKVLMLPAHPDQEKPSHFSLGATKEEVLAVQGTPTLVRGNKWSYKLSDIHFREGRVVGYNNFFETLKVKMAPTSVSPEVLKRGYFTIGSTQDDVLALQGTPTAVQGNIWSFKLSDVIFHEGRVRAANDFSGNLKFVPIQPADNS